MRQFLDRYALQAAPSAPKPTKPNGFSLVKRSLLGSRAGPIESRRGGGAAPMVATLVGATLQGGCDLVHRVCLSSSSSQKPMPMRRRPYTDNGKVSLDESDAAHMWSGGSLNVRNCFVLDGVISVDDVATMFTRWHSKIPACPQEVALPQPHQDSFAVAGLHCTCLATVFAKVHGLCIKMLFLTPTLTTSAR